MVSRYPGFLLDRAGTAAVEFALVSPLLFVMLLGMIQFAVIFNNISVLNNATAAGAVLFSEGRSFPAPYTSAVSTIKTAAATLKTANPQ